MVGLLARMMNAQVTNPRFCLPLRAAPNPLWLVPVVPRSRVSDLIYTCRALRLPLLLLRNGAEGSKGSALNIFIIYLIVLAILGETWCFRFVLCCWNFGNFGNLAFLVFFSLSMCLSVRRMT